MFGVVLALRSVMSHPSSAFRYLCSELVSVLYEDRFCGVREALGNLEEISSTSATVLVEEPLEDGRPVSFRVKGHALHGIVESTDFVYQLGWFVRIGLNSTSRWHVRMFIPEHFLALGESAFWLETESVAMCAS